MNKLLFGIMTCLLAISAQATPITSFEAGSLADNGLTLTQGIASRATIQSSVTLGGATLLPTEGDHLLKLIAGTSADIINPLFPNELTTLVDLDDLVNIDKAFLIFDVGFMNSEVSRNDRQRIGINGTIYDLTGSSEAGYIPSSTLGWQRVAIHFNQTGHINLSFACVNSLLNGASSLCLFDNIYTADSIPMPELNGIPVITPLNQIDIAIAPVPEPSSYILMATGLGLLAITTRRRKLATVPI